MPAASLTLVVPCHNEETRLDRDAFLEWVSASPSQRLCFVNDASTDQTAQVLNGMARKHPRIRVLDLTQRHGKAGAVRAGILVEHATDLLGFWDADLSAPLEESDRLAEVLTQEPRLQCVAGIRLMRLGSTIERGFVRHVLGRLFASVASPLLGLYAYDTQCGAKVFRREIVQLLFADDFVSPWLFDIELYLRLRQFNRGADLGEHVLEHPLTEWRAVEHSRLRLGHFLRAPLDLIAIHRRYR